MDQYALLYITTSSMAEAKNLARTLVEEKLIGCANLFDNVTSIYRYNNEIKEDQETIIIAKTPHINIETAIKRTKELHSYDCPCIVVIPITQGYSTYLRWLSEATI